VRSTSKKRSYTLFASGECTSAAAEPSQRRLNTATSVTGREEAATKIQAFWRLHQFKESFLRDGYQAYLNLLLPQDQLSHAAGFAYGQTGAKINDDRYFPITNPYIKDRQYRVCNGDELIIKLIVDAYLAHPQYDQYGYIPLARYEYYSTMEVIKNLQARFDDVTVCQFESLSILLLRYDKSDIKQAEQIISAINATGLV